MTEGSLPARPSVPALLLATWFGTGRLPIAPGSWASLSALPVAWVLVWAGGPWLLLLAIIGLIPLGLWATDRYIIAFDEHDPRAVVVDEIVGQWATLLVAPLDPLAYACAFALFRLADVLKPFPVGWLDRHVGGAIGVMVDDLGAAVYAGLGVVVLGIWLWP